MGNNIERGPEPQKIQQTKTLPEESPGLCLKSAINSMTKEGYTPDHPALNSVGPEVEYGGEKEVALKCARCGSGCSLTHKDGEVVNIDEFKIRPTFGEDCLYY